MLTEQSGPRQASATVCRTLLALTSLNLNTSFHNHTIGVKAERNMPRRAAAAAMGMIRTQGHRGPAAAVRTRAVNLASPGRFERRLVDTGDLEAIRIGSSIRIPEMAGIVPADVLDYGPVPDA
jgi:hypothetical protein